MYVEELKGKSICMYPANHLTERLQECKDMLSFEIAHVFQSKKDRELEQIIQILKDADCLFITEENAITLFLPPFQKETEFYQLLLENAYSLNRPIVIQGSQKVINTTAGDITLQSLEYKKYDSLCEMDEELSEKQNLVIMVAGISGKNNLFHIMFNIKETLQKYKCSSKIICNKIYREMLTVQSNDSDEIKINDLVILIEGLDLNYNLFPKEEIPKEELEAYQQIQRISVDIGFLTADGKDSCKMIEETISFYEEEGIHIGGIFLQNEESLWQKVYLEEKLGLPVMMLDNGEWPNQLVTILFSYFGIK